MTASDLAELKESGKPWATMMLVNEWMDIASDNEEEGVMLMVDDWCAMDTYEQAVAAQYMFGQIVSFRELLTDIENLDDTD